MKAEVHKYWVFRKYPSFISLLLFLLELVMEYFLGSSTYFRNGFGELQNTVGRSDCMLNRIIL